MIFFFLSGKIVPNIAQTHYIYFQLTWHELHIWYNVIEKECNTTMRAHLERGLANCRWMSMETHSSWCQSISRSDTLALTSKKVKKIQKVKPSTNRTTPPKWWFLSLKMLKWTLSIPCTYQRFLIWGLIGLNNPRNSQLSLATLPRVKNGLPKGISRRMNSYIIGWWKMGLGWEGLPAMLLTLVIMNHAGQ